MIQYIQIDFYLNCWGEGLWGMLKKRDLKAKIILQVHDEMMIEAPESEKEEVKDIMKKEMESAIQLKIPLVAEISEAKNWYDCK